MKKPGTAVEALVRADTMARGLEEARRKVVKKVHRLVLSEFGSTPVKLFGVQHNRPDTLARAAMVFFFRRLRGLGLEPQWIARYLWCSQSDVETLENAAARLIREHPGGEFATKIRSTCTHLNVSLSDLRAQ